VNRLEAQLSDKAKVIRLDIFSRVGRQAAARFGVRGVPLFVLLDGQGQVIYSQYGIPLPGRFVEKVDYLIAGR
jgi:thioredoxin-related protein